MKPRAIFRLHHDRSLASFGRNAPVRPLKGVGIDGGTVITGAYGHGLVPPRASHSYSRPFATIENRHANADDLEAGSSPSLAAAWSFEAAFIFAYLREDPMPECSNFRNI